MGHPLVFVSYSHKDEAQKDKLLSQLGVLQADLFDVWSDDRVGAGVNWEKEIIKSISQAKVAILLITDNFLSSKFILQTEVKTLLERREREGVHVFPVIAKACAWRRVKWLSEMNVRPKNRIPVWGDGGTHVDEDLATIAEELADILEKATDAATEDLARAASEPVSSDFQLSAPPAISPSKALFADHPTKPTDSPKILIVDDNALFRDAVIDGLQDMNIVPVEADSPAKATHVLNTNPDIRVILLDLEFNDGESGTALLESIKHRASFYRVIILTSHDELLAAETASSYNVFDYLSKVNGRAPMQTLRFNITRALDDLKRGDTSEPGDSMNRYPTPFVYIYQHLKSDMTPLERLISQKDMLELLLHFSGVVLLSEYLNSAERSDDLDAQIRRRIYKPTLGDWFNIVNEIVKRSPAGNDTSFLNSFLTFFTSRNKKILGDFIAVRNKYVGHGTKHSDYEYQDVVKKCDAWLETLLEGYRFVTRFLLCYVLNVQIIRSKYLYSLKECVGANPQLLNSTKPLNLVLNTHEMHLVNLATEPSQTLSLYPFMILENCADCRQLEIFFYSKCSNGQLHYISYKTGHWIIKEEAAEDFLALLGLTQQSPNSI
jgi:DNA-binding response OmpR family regulator